MHPQATFWLQHVQPVQLANLQLQHLMLHGSPRSLQLPHGAHAATLSNAALSNGLFLGPFIRQHQQQQQMIRSLAMIRRSRSGRSGGGAMILLRRLSQ